ncbi:MAG: hypothetical protein QM813_06635 [Verrucomicrobiota bacterium]
MDAFTADLAKIGVPTFESGAFFQQAVTNLNVWSNVKRCCGGDEAARRKHGILASNYGPDNAAQVPGASSQVFDFGDAANGRTSGYGSMQIHNPAERQTIFAFNHWSEGAGGDLGIGNGSGSNLDWTFAKNLGNYSSARLRVLVRP